MKFIINIHRLQITPNNCWIWLYLYSFWQFKPN